MLAKVRSGHWVDYLDGRQVGRLVLDRGEGWRFRLAGPGRDWSARAYKSLQSARRALRREAERV